MIKELFLFLQITLIAFSGCKKSEVVVPPVEIDYPVHENITVTYFYVGEPADSNNGYIPNDKSSWDGFWQQHYGGVDDPVNRNGNYPKEFIPKENPFYFALPYNDFGTDGNRKQSAADLIYWAKDKTWNASESMCKNQWIKITKGSKSVYAQWEDCGPYYYDDSNYVFGSALPLNQINYNSSGLDVSPAVRDYLGLADVDTVSWQFIRAANVPGGPWKTIITTSQLSY